MGNYMKRIEYYIKALIINKKKYLFLSITITISVVLLFGYIIVEDSTMFNRYKELLPLKDDISVVLGNDDGKDLIKMRDILRKSKSINYGYTYCEQQQVLKQYGNLNVQIQFIPNTIFEHYVFSGNYLKKVLFEKDNVHIADDEIIVEKNFYDYLNKHNINTIMLPISIEKGKKIVKKVKVIGYCIVDDELLKKDNLSVEYSYIFASNSLLKETNQCVNYKTLLFSDDRNELEKIQTQYNLDIYSIKYYKENAKQEMLNKVKSKFVLLIIIYFLLSINLYSSFSNCLSSRKYEIGVMRAIGISRKNIIKQFFFEGMVITILNVIISVWIGLFLVIVFKCLFAESGWIIYMSKYSVFDFLGISIFLCLFYSVLFAYKTTKVDILENLRNE